MIEEIDMKKRNKQIEGLRGIGCLMILLYHLLYRYCEIYRENYNVWGVSSLIHSFGTYGVLLFFIISFFFMGNRQNEVNMVITYLKRYYKLLVPYTISVSIIYLCEQFMDLPGRSVDLKTYLINLTMFQTMFGYRDVDGAHWYLYTLLILSAWIIMIESVPKYRPLLYLSFLILVEGMTYTGFAERLFQPMYACIAVFVIMIKYYIDYKKENKNCLIIVLSAVISLGVIAYHHGIAFCAVFLFLITLFILCYYHKIQFAQKFALVYIGSLSFYIYLIHQNISYMILNTITNQLGTFHLWYSLFCVPIIWGLAVGIKAISERIYGLANRIWMLIRKMRDAN